MTLPLACPTCGAHLHDLPWDGGPALSAALVPSAPLEGMYPFRCHPCGLTFRAVVTLAVRLSEIPITISFAAKEAP